MTIPEVLNHIALGRDLDEQSASWVIERILEGGLTDSQVSAILMGLKMKGESLTEVAAFAKVMRKMAVDMSIPELPLIDTCGTGGDGKQTFNISTISAIIAAGAGCFVAKHGNRSVSSSCGSADVLAELGIPAQAPIEKVKIMIQENGIGFLFAPDMHLAMKYVMPVRKSLGIRTIFNVLGPLTNPARAKKQIIGVFEEKLLNLYGNVLLEMNHEEAYIVHGKDGLDEVSISTPTQVVHLENGSLTSFQVSPEEFGVNRVPVEEIQSSSSLENVRIIWEILNGKKGPRRDIACLNSAFAIKLGGKAKDLYEAYKVAEDSIDSGKARLVLEKWQKYFS